uniref:NADH dehydrogenase subunit 5 n=1 Tax=Loimia medusa TaxID=167822 RepID=UPI0031F3A5E4
MIKLYNTASVASYILYILSFLVFFTSMYFNFYSLTFVFIWELTSFNSSSLYFPIIFDPIGLMFSAVVLFISANVMKFAVTYMTGDPFLKRFIYLVYLFILSMNMLIYFPHLMTLLLGWDGLGLVSFILVIYYQNPKSLGAGMITALTNRIGDVALLVAIAWTLNSNNWFIFNVWPSSFNTLIIISILIAAMTKSAQMPFSSWLPAAMAAPTPVSALVHSSTLVTAGVFLLIRFHSFLSSLNIFSTLLFFASGLTMFMAGMAALTECDMKKIIALSTLSQLGVMMLALSIGLPKLAFFHLITHALFKALLFICAGSIIHFHHHGQDLRTIGNLTLQLPFTMTTLLIANMSLCAMPFLAGFYSKDLILETALFSNSNIMFIFLLFLATAFTSAYSLRMLILGIWNSNMSNPTHFISNNDLNILTPTFLLSIGAIISGSFINWQMGPFSQEVFLPSYFKFLPLAATFMGLFFMWVFYSSFSSSSPMWIKFKILHEASCSMWFLAPLSTQNMLKTPYSLALYFQKILDNGWTETMSAKGAFSLLSASADKFLPLQNNMINSILYLMFLTAPLYLFLLLL